LRHRRCVRVVEPVALELAREDRAGRRVAQRGTQASGKYGMSEKTLQAATR